ncbi:MAG TPA: sensor domain-containing protein, partial [Mycobacterium sp.]
HDALSEPDQDHAATILRRSQEATLPRIETPQPAATIAETAAATPPPPVNTPPTTPYATASSQSSGPIPAQPPRPWAPDSGPIPAASQANPAPPYQAGSGNWGGPPSPPPQFAAPPAWNQPPAKPRRNPWPIIAAVSILLVVAVGAVGVWYFTRSKPTPPPEPIPADRLSALLLSPSDVNSVMGASNIQPGKPIRNMDTSARTLSSPECQGALYTTQESVYAGTGYTGMSELLSAEPGDNNDHWVDQAVVAFPSADKAKDFLQTSADKWKPCAGQTVTVTNQGKTYRWTLAQLVGSPPKITMMQTQEGAGGWECQHAMSVANNVIVDVNACGYHISDQGAQIADKIVGKVDNQ